MRRAQLMFLRALERTGFARLWRFLHRRHVTILMLHGVADEGDASWTPLRPRLGTAELERHLLSLRRAGYRFVPLADAVAMLAGERPVEPYTIAVTFDDGYRNNATRALPVLRRLGIPLTLFVPTGKIERRVLFAFDRLDYALQRIPAEEIPVAVGPVRRTLRARPRAAFAAGFDDLRSAIKTTLREPRLESCPEISALLRSCEERAGTTLEEVKESCAFSALLEWDEVEALAREPGVDVQSHTVDHVRLAHADDATAREELLRSKAALEARTGRPCVHVAYPDGEYDARTARIAREAGYTCGVTTRIGLNARGRHLMELSRIALPLGGADEAELFAHVSGFYEAFARLRARLSRLFSRRR